MDNALRDESSQGDRNRLQAILSAADLIGALGRRTDVVVVDISRSGCLLESPSDIPIGTLAVVRVQMDGEEYSDAVRVTRSQRMAGAGERYRIGTEFAWLSAPDKHSVRRLASAISSGVRRPARDRV
jgi:PilZ domain-containing protein